MIISIAKPCAENWQTMTPADKGRFCNACQKCVTDFTTMTDAEIIQFLNTNKTNTCGRFTTEQLNRELKTPHSFKLPLSKWILASTFSLSFMSPKQGLAAVPMVQTDKIIKPSQANFVSQNVENEGLTDRVIIRGKVTDLNNEVLPTASVVLQGTTIGVLTDDNGNFALNIPVEFQHKNIVLAVSCVGLETQQVLINTESVAKNIEVKLKEMLFIGELVVEHYKPTLRQRFKRLFRKKYRS